MSVLGWVGLLFGSLCPQYNWILMYILASRAFMGMAKSVGHSAWLACGCCSVVLGVVSSSSASRIRIGISFASAWQCILVVLLPLCNKFLAESVKGVSLVLD